MRYSTLLDSLQNLTNTTPSVGDLSKITGLTEKNIYARRSYDREFSEEEIKKIENHYNIKLISQINIVNKNSVVLDYYPDVCGSCGNGVFEFSTFKEQMIVPQSAFCSRFSPTKQYFVINAYGNSMSPTIMDKDKLIVEHWEGEQIIDNKPYIFCRNDEIFIKRLVKNVDQLLIIPDNKDYDTIKLTGNRMNEVDIIGQIVGLMRDLR